LLFNAGCNKQVFFPKPGKKIGADLFVVFEKNALLIPKKWRHCAGG